MATHMLLSGWVVKAYALHTVACPHQGQQGGKRLGEISRDRSFTLVVVELVAQSHDQLCAPPKQRTQRELTSVPEGVNRERVDCSRDREHPRPVLVLEFTGNFDECSSPTAGALCLSDGDGRTIKELRPITHEQCLFAHGTAPVDVA
jgi:hypothetical protein